MRTSVSNKCWGRAGRGQENTPFFTSLKSFLTEFSLFQVDLFLRVISYAFLIRPVPLVIMPPTNHNITAPTVAAIIPGMARGLPFGPT
jgi:hypothetical protein